MSRYFGLLAATLATLLWSATALAAPVLVAPAGITDTTISKMELKRIALGTATTMPSGARVELVLPPDGSATLAGFCADVTGMDAGAFAKHWLKRTMSGAGAPPKQLGGAEAIAYLGSHPGAIAVVDSAEVSGGVHTVAITD